MSAEKLFLLTTGESGDTISARKQLLDSFRDAEYRHEFVKERVRSSVALQIRALRAQRDLTQVELGDALGMAQTWVSKLENPDYGKMTVATLLRLAEAFDTDLEIKFRPFSETLDRLPKQTQAYFITPSFAEEFGATSDLPDTVQDDSTKLSNGSLSQQRSDSSSIYASISRQATERMAMGSAAPMKNRGTQSAIS